MAEGGRGEGGGAIPKKRRRKSPKEIMDELFDKYLHCRNGLLRIFWVGGCMLNDDGFSDEEIELILKIDLSQYRDLFRSFQVEFDEGAKIVEELAEFDESGHVRAFFAADGCTLGNLVLGLNRAVKVQMDYIQKKFDQMHKRKKKITKEKKKIIKKAWKIINNSDYGAATDPSDISSAISSSSHGALSDLIETLSRLDWELWSDIEVDSFSSSSSKKTTSPKKNQTPKKTSPSVPPVIPSSPVIEQPKETQQNGTPPIQDPTVPDQEETQPPDQPPIKPKKKKRRRRKKPKKDAEICINIEEFTRRLNRRRRKPGNILKTLDAAIAKKNKKLTPPVLPASRDLEQVDEFMEIYRERLREPIQVETRDDFPPLFDLNAWTPPQPPVPSPIASPIPPPPESPVKPTDPVPSPIKPTDPVPSPVKPPSDPISPPVPPAVKTYLIDGIRYDIYTDEDLINKLCKLHREGVELSLKAVAPSHNSNDYGTARVFTQLCKFHNQSYITLTQELRNGPGAPLYITLNEEYAGFKDQLARDLPEDMNGLRVDGD